MKILEQDDDGNVWINTTADGENYVRMNYFKPTKTYLEQLWKELDQLLWEKDTKIHNENIKQKG